MTTIPHMRSQTMPQASSEGAAPEPALKDRVRSIAAQLSLGAVEGSLNAYGIACDAVHRNDS